MEKEKGVSSGFIIIASIIVMGIVGCFYMNEKKFIENSLTITSNITDIKNEPRKRIIQIKTEDGRTSEPILFVTVPFWDTRKIGEQIIVRIGTEAVSQVKVDEFIYLYKISISILAGCSILLGILSGVLFFRKSDRYF